MKIVLIFACGLLFGFGLVLSELHDPATIIGFVDFTGDWNPQLLVAMFSAVAVHFVAHRFALRQRRPWLAPRFSLPTRRDLDWRLLLGSSVFGVGWGMTGVCPGPSLVRLGSGASDALYSVPAMVVGFALFELAQRLGARSNEPMRYAARP